MWEHEISAGLPPPREEDPTALRQDILDELTDHLQCALRREVLLGSSETDALMGPDASAQQRVLARFGDPAAIARRLWFDAFREQFMTQRLTLAAVVVLTGICIALFVMTWRAQAVNQDLLMAQQQSTQQLLAELQRLSSRPENSAPAPAAPEQPSEWNRLSVRCVYDQPGGEPAAGIVARLSGQSENTNGIPAMTETSDATGKIDFGLLLYGEYSLQFTAGEFTQQQWVAVRPGQDREIELVCPRPKQTATAKLELTLPDSQDLPEEVAGRLWLIASLWHDNRNAGLNYWRSTPNQPVTLVIRPDGQAVIDAPPEWFETQELPVVNGGMEGAGTGPARFARWRTRWRAEANWSTTLQLIPANYQITELQAGLTDPDDPSGLTCLRGFDVPGAGRLLGEREPAPQFSYGRGTSFRGDAALFRENLLSLEVGSFVFRKAILATQVPAGMRVVELGLQIPDSSTLDAWQSLTASDSLTLMTHLAMEGAARPVELFRQVAAVGRDRTGHILSWRDSTGLEYSGPVPLSPDSRSPYGAPNGSAEYVTLLLYPEEEALLKRLSGDLTLTVVPHHQHPLTDLSRMDRATIELLLADARPSPFSSRGGRGGFARTRAIAVPPEEPAEMAPAETP